MQLIIALSWIIASRGAAQTPVPSPENPEVVPAGRERLLMDANWRFMLSNKADEEGDQSMAGGLAKQNFPGGPRTTSFDDHTWRQVDLPHDWGVELPFDPKAGGFFTACHPLGFRYPDTSIGWYRKHFKLPASDKGRRFFIEFDGVVHDCMVFVNGFFIGTHFSPYTSFSYDVTDMVHPGQDNLVAVRVDATKHEGWFYQGAGIYRHVWLTKTAPIHVPQWGTQVVTAVSYSDAKVITRTQVKNDSGQPASVVVESDVVAGDGQMVASASAPPQPVQPGQQLEVPMVAEVPNPKLWSLESPTLYRLATTLKVDGVEVDHVETPFGVRTVQFDVNRGFLLNGQVVKLKGMCDHQNMPGVGMGCPDSIWDWRIKRLKSMGTNAIRMAHNPPAPEYLDACDRLGMLVMDEQRIFSSGEEGIRQLDSMVRRDRNHPSIIIWSAGNEEFGVQDGAASEPVMVAMQNEFHRLDPTRQVTFASCNGEQPNGINKVVEVRGINYIRQFSPKQTPDQYHELHPNQPIVATEEDAGARTWEFAKARPWFSGLFIWSGFDYYGESNWPSTLGTYGVMDFCGNSRGSYWYYAKEWAGKQTPPGPPGGNIAATIDLSPDRAAVNADGEDTDVVNVKIVDAQHHPMQNARNVVVFTVSGPGKILGVGNGDPQSHEPDKSDRRSAYYGHAQVLVQATKTAGPILLTASSDGLQPTTLTIPSNACTPQPSVP